MEEKYSRGGAASKNKSKKPWGSCRRAGIDAAFSESAICSSQVHPPSTTKSNFKFKTLRWPLLRWRLTLSEPKNRTGTGNRNRRSRFSQNRRQHWNHQNCFSGTKLETGIAGVKTYRTLEGAGLAPKVAPRRLGLLTPELAIF